MASLGRACKSARPKASIALNVMCVNFEFYIYLGTKKFRLVLTTILTFMSPKPPRALYEVEDGTWNVSSHNPN